jgi:hypothetical protein
MGADLDEWRSVERTIGEAPRLFAHRDDVALEIGDLLQARVRLRRALCRH